MIAPDANLLIYAIDSNATFHRQGRQWLESVLSGIEPVGIPILSIHAFLRFTTNERVGHNPISLRTANEIVDSWLDLPHVRILYPNERHWPMMKSLSAQVRVSGALVSDLALAAIVQEHGAMLYTNDRDFARFPGLRWQNPLQS